MSTHRHIQLSNLEDKLSSLRSSWYNAARKAAELGNRGALSHFMSKTHRAESILRLIRSRIYG